MRFAPHTDDDVRSMLDAIGLDSLDALFDQIPADVRVDHALDIPDGVSEMEILADLRSLAARNRHADDLVCFAGAGAYDHYVPSVVWALAGRSELYTSYTPYQPELSQGVLQVLFEYQSMICDLTGLEVSNASLYDGPTSLVEAANMAHAATRRSRVLVSELVDPRYVQVLETYGRGNGIQVSRFGSSADGTSAVPAVGEDVAAVVLQHPNHHGVLEDARGVFAAAAAGGARSVQVFDPLSLGVLAPPSELGADIAVAEGQVLGNHLNYGGPYLGLIAARQQDVRRMPGRIVGETLDVRGQVGYVLTLQAREQHIRREKATSNICTNQTLMAIAATVYLGWLGPGGLGELGRQCAARAGYALERLTSVDGVEPLHPGASFFKEFGVRLPRPAADVVEAMAERGFLAGVPLPDADGHALLVAVTERRTRDEIDRFAEALGEVLA